MHPDELKSNSKKKKNNTKGVREKYGSGMALWLYFTTYVLETIEPNYYTEPRVECNSDGRIKITLLLKTYNKIREIKF